MRTERDSAGCKRDIGGDDVVVGFRVFHDPGVGGVRALRHDDVADHRVPRGAQAAIGHENHDQAVAFGHLHHLVLDRAGVGVDVDRGSGHALSATCGPGWRARASSAPEPSALSLPTATARDSGAMPQLVQGWTRSASACFSAPSIVAATCSGVSTVVDATSIAPISSTLSGSREISEIGTCELAHSNETWLIDEAL